MGHPNTGSLYGQWHDQQIEDVHACFVEQGCSFTLSEEKHSWLHALHCLIYHRMTLIMIGIYSEA